MKPTQVTEIISIVKKYLTCEKLNAVITLRIKDADSAYSNLAGKNKHITN